MVLLSEIFGSVVAVLIFGLLANIICSDTKNKGKDKKMLELKEKCSNLEMERSLWNLEKSSLELEKSSLELQNALLTEKVAQLKNAYTEILNLGQKTSIDDEVKEAIRFAMKNSHPDKPTGNQELFIKFHQLYKKHCN